MKRADITATIGRLSKTGYGTVKADEVDYIQELIAQHKPKSFIEIGMASGISTGFIAQFLEEHCGGGRLVSLDHDDTFFGDTTKPNGFLYPEIYKGNKVDAELIKFKTAPDVHEIDGDFEMAFIDANHQHPWPGIDMMALYPRMTGPKIMVHHDLFLFRLQGGKPIGIGPKMLFDQFPESHRHQSTANNGNIFSVDLNMSKDRFEALMTDLLALPWSLQGVLSETYVEKIQRLIKQDYSTALYDHFMRCLQLNNEALKPRSANDKLAKDIQMLQKKLAVMDVNIGQTFQKTLEIEDKVTNIQFLVRKGMLRRVISKLSGKS
jgi:hypothetical protein